MAEAKHTAGSNPYRKTPRPFIPSTDPRGDALGAEQPEPVGRDLRLHPSLIDSRANLCRALDALAGHRDALTVIGAHAVHEQTRGLGFPSTSTKGGDAAVTPALVGDEPRLEDAMRASGFRTLMELAAELPYGHPGKSRWSSRQGLWAFSINDNGAPVGEVDLMAPEALAGSGRRSVGTSKDHGATATGRVAGIELAVVERDLLPLEDFETGLVRSAWVARSSGLICAKAYKITDRLAINRGGAARLASIPKDATDMWRCMAVSGPEVVLGQFKRHLRTSISEAISEGLDRFTSLVHNDTMPAMIIQHLGSDPKTEDEVSAGFNDWARTFKR